MVNTAEISEVVKQSMLDYGVSVIRGRALADVRDGLKPIHRRILYAMKDLGLDKGPTVKSAKIIGHVIGSYSPHGDASAYDAAVRMAQDFVSTIPTIQGQGNMGSLNDPSSYAAMRYSEMRLSKFAVDLFFDDIGYDCVDMVPNFDGTTMEPEVLPARLPYYLLTSNIGIAVAFVSSSLPYNFNEVCELVKVFVPKQNGKKIQPLPEETVLKLIKGPDFATGGIIIEKNGIIESIKTGQSVIKVRCKYHVKGDVIHITEIPYTLSKSRLIESIADVTQDRKEKSSGEIIKAKINEISSLKDFSSTKNGTDIQIKVKKGMNPEVVMNKLFKFTLCQNNLKLISTCIVNGQPLVLGVQDILVEWYKFRIQTLSRKYKYLLKQTRDRLHILNGFNIVLSDPEKAISLIKAAEDRSTAKDSIKKYFKLDEVQAEAVISMQVYKFSKQEIFKVREEIKMLKEREADYVDIIKSRRRKNDIILQDVQDLQDKYGRISSRRTQVLNVMTAENVEDEDIIELTDNMIYLTKRGYIKRVVEGERNTQRVQNRGGKGRKFSGKDDDFVTETVSCSSHDDLFFITTLGKVYCRKAFKIPETNVDNIGINVATILNLQDDEKVSTFFHIPKGKKDYHIITLTQNGLVKRTSFNEHYGSVGRESGLIACKLRNGDKVVFATAIPENQAANLMVFTDNGKAITFDVKEIPLVARTTFGSNAHKNKTAKVVSAEVITKEDYKNEVPILILNVNGKGKRTKVNEFRICRRNTMGVIAIELQKGEKVASVCKAPDGMEACVVSNTNIIRIETDSIRIVKRPTFGYRVMKLEKDQKVVSVNVI
jgi:DNA gyrase subunit A